MLIPRRFHIKLNRKGFVYIFHMTQPTVLTLYIRASKALMQAQRCFYIGKFGIL